MEQDIRELFKAEDDLKQLPKGHKEGFLNKLKTSQQNKSNQSSKSNGFNKSNWSIYYRIAAILVIGLSISYGILNISISDETKENTALLEQIETIEKEYLTNIDTEWQNFLALTTDENLIQRYEKRLNELDKDYQEISQQFQENTNNIYIIEALVENLQTRLQLLKDIQEHINILNQEKNEHHENTI